MSKLFMNEKEIETLLSWSYEKPRDFALFHTALATGFRAGDLLNLKRWDVAPRGRILGCVKIKMQKTGKIAERRLPPTCQIAIERYLSLRVDSNPFLFQSESTRGVDNERPMNRSSLHRIIKGYLEHMYSGEELRGNACHVTRRSVAKIISDKAGRVEPATRFLEHTSIANTIHYLDMDQYGKQADQIVETLPWSTNT
jgi:integrase